ncbi:MAG: 3',5'-cyclic-AMP phosphodiesterase [Candidatus Competibacteraceae bacterium]|nr:3',5'-cyclic-AMP phosphodiesterase [Candidatus Competibacteraceae bacterium]MCP5127230.1 3',5'-cyclic-AMP phosphodiesterase [Gammaproteobacteria bacterium]HRX71092.1 3',5'-cyclic-AMP phosphodiesterase [Candidatus Competibacteraceae bacterium]
MSTVASPTPLRVIQITDLHLKAQPGSRTWGIDVDAGLNTVLAHIQENYPAVDLMLVTGDLVGDEPEAYERVRQRLELLELPVYCLPGNHDFPATMSWMLRNGWVRRKRHVVTDHWQFVLLDSSFPGTPDGHLAYSELALLDTLLVTDTDRHTVVCLHHNPVSSQTPWLDTMMVSNHAALFSVLDRYSQVRAVVWGHIHAEFSARRNGVHLLATPATCVQFKPRVPEPQVDDLPPGYRWFELYPDGVLRTGVERVG